MLKYFKNRLDSWYKVRYAVWKLTTISGVVYQNMTKERALELLEEFSDAIHIEKSINGGVVRFYPQQEKVLICK